MAKKRNKPNKPKPTRIDLEPHEINGAEGQTLTDAPVKPKKSKRKRQQGKPKIIQLQSSETEQTSISNQQSPRRLSEEVPLQQDEQGANRLNKAQWDAPQLDGPRVDGPRLDVDAPRLEGPRIDGLNVDGPRLDAPRVDLQAPRVDLDMGANIRNEAEDGVRRVQDAPRRLLDDFQDGMRLDNLGKQNPAETLEAAKPKASPLKKILLIAGIVALVLLVILLAFLTFRFIRSRMAYANMDEERGFLNNTALTTPYRSPSAASPNSIPSQTTEAYLWPLQSYGRVSSCYGTRTLLNALNFHKGLDVAVPSGTPVVASRSGMVERYRVSNDARGFGTYVALRHADGIVTLYAHLTPQLSLQVGQNVLQGDVIAQSGNTGFSTGPHLHFEVIDTTGKSVNPAQFISSRNNQPMFNPSDQGCWANDFLSLQIQ